VVVRTLPRKLAMVHLKRVGLSPSVFIGLGLMCGKPFEGESEREVRAVPSALTACFF